MNDSERSALRLAARLLESGFAPCDPPAPTAAEGPLLGVYLASRLARVAADPRDAGRIAESLRSAAGGQTGLAAA